MANVVSNTPTEIAVKLFGRPVQVRALPGGRFDIRMTIESMLANRSIFRVEADAQETVDALQHALDWLAMKHVTPGGGT